MINIKEIRELLISLKSDIRDDYRASYDPDDDTPSMSVTIATTDGDEWSFQTGDNSYSGGAYGHCHWHVLTLERRSNCANLARECLGELLSMVQEQKEYDDERAAARRLEVYNDDNH